MPEPRENESAAIKQYLADHDAPCPGCTYNLRGTQGAKCPECGRGIDLAELREAESLRAWRESRLPSDRLLIAGMIGAILGLAWPVGVTVVLIRGHGGSGAVSLLNRLVLVAGAAGHVAMAWLYLSRTSWIAGRRREVRLGLALAAWLLGPSVVLLVAVLALARGVMHP